MKHLLLASAASIALIGASNANAGEFYVGLFGGMSASQGHFSAHTSASASGVNIGQYFNSLITRTNIYRKYQSTDWESDVENGWAIGATLGYNLVHGPRIEIEEAYRQFDLSGSGGGQERSRAQMRLFDGNSFSASFNPHEQENFNAQITGTKSTWSLMTNMWFDFELGPVTPFVGGGIGLAYVDIDYSAQEIQSTSIGPQTCNRPDPYPDLCPTATALPAHATSIDEESWALAYQAGAGIGWSLNDSAILSAQYRIFATIEPDLANEDNSTRSHEILFGINIPFQR